MSTEICVPARLKKAARAYKLTPRQIQVLVALCEGDTWKAAASRLDISLRTVRFHSQNIFRKTGAQSAVMALAVILLHPPAQKGN